MELSRLSYNRFEVISFQIIDNFSFVVATGLLLFINDRRADIFAGRCRKKLLAHGRKLFRCRLTFRVFQLNRDQSRDEANLGFVALSTLSIERLFCPPKDVDCSLSPRELSSPEIFLPFRSDSFISRLVLCLICKNM